MNTLKPKDKVIIAFSISDMTWASYAGEATLLRVNTENWSVDGKKAEVHWDVELPSGDTCTFPLSSIHKLGASPIQETQGESKINTPSTSLMLRDYFAGKALLVTLPAYNLLLDDEIDGAAKRAYDVADAMLRAREIQA